MSTNEVPGNDAALEAETKARLEASLPASLRDVTNVTVQRWRSGVVKVAIRVYDEVRRGTGQGPQ